MLDRFFIHQINAQSSCCYLSKFYCRKETWGYAKVIHKKKRKEKNGDEKKWIQKCPGYLKQWVLRCPPEKKEMNKIAPILLQMFLSFKKRDMFSRSIVELG